MLIVDRDHRCGSFSTKLKKMQKVYHAACLCCCGIWIPEFSGDSGSNFAEYRRGVSTVFIFWFTLNFIYELSDPNDFTAGPSIFILPFVLRLICWAVTIWLLLWAVQSSVSETRKRQLTLLAGFILVLPAALFFMIPLWELYKQRSDLHKSSQAIRTISHIFSFVVGTGAGLFAGIQTSASALLQLKYEKVRSIYIATVIVGVGSRLSFLIMAAQLWNTIDSLALAYVMLWQMLYVLRAYSEYIRSNEVRCVVWVIRASVIAVAISRFANLDPDVRDLIVDAILQYLEFTIRSTVTVAIVGYFTSMLTRLIILGEFIPEHADAEELVELRS